MNQNIARPPNFRGRVQTLIGGVALVGAGFGAWWMWLQKRQARKEDPAHGGALPTWEYRIYQAQHPADSTNSPVTLRQSTPLEPGVSSTQPGPVAGTQSPPNRADQAVPYAPQTKSGSSDHNVRPGPGPEPTPQRTSSDGRVYSKAPAYADSYKEKKNK
ncbi:hypothetical protein K503DRAFT_868084 [Rhizopogon vinicolor AM-OR11-026]|uniref:Uncharacterized protein n=1 Tax=Rhizopogon vinicolor AM-OR11-026 TaxID=1314800 RepID=A0A1B7MSU1_9AGAM|nr:hypothetical protein K503DRAFT_868084 [Rhizopogon vinicolor AM-OR11-026]